MKISIASKPLQINCKSTPLLVQDIRQVAQGDDSGIKMPGCVCWGSENVPIMKDALGQKNIPILKGSLAHLIPILWCNIKLKFIIHKGN